MSDFVHLRTHSSATIKDGVLSPKELPKLAAKAHQDAIALTDCNRMLGTIKFYKAAQAAGVKPIIGIDVWVEADVTSPVAEGDLAAQPQFNRMILLCQTHEGYEKLIDWVSRGYLDNQKRLGSDSVAFIKQSWLRDEGTQGLIGLSGDMEHGEVAQAVLLDDINEARTRSMRALHFYRSAFGDRYYIEVQRYNQPKEGVQVERLAKLASATGIPLVATQPVQFAKRDDFFIHELRYCQSHGEVITAAGRQPVFTPEQYFKSSEEMAELFSDLPEAVTNSGAIAQRCNVELNLGKFFLPHFDTPNNISEADYMIQLAKEGLNERLEAYYPDPQERERERPRYDARLQTELDTIVRMDFPGYFLIVSDFIRWAKDQDIPVGPGRGSGAGSLVAYSLKITDINPLPYGLLFERFLNPERISMPDFDVDFEYERRDQVIAYVRQKYGDAAVSQIATLGTLAARAAVQAAAAAFGVAPMARQNLSKLIPQKPPGLTIHQALFGDPKKPDIKIVPELVERYENEAETNKILKLAMQLEKMPSNVGTHASGVLIAHGTISQFSPLYYDPSSKSAAPVSQYDKDDVEAAGLVKFDFLGLKTLDIIYGATQNINRRPEFKGAPFDLSKVSLKDSKTFENLRAGDTVAVFQLEGVGMTRTVKSMRPDTFEDMVALVAMYRPGPMDLIPTLIRRKHGQEEVLYPDPRVEPVLKETYGIMVYQEQVMQMAQIIGGYTLGGADLLRRAMGKKKVEEMEKERAKFREGAQKNGLTAEKADQIFDDMEKFAGYGFNKSHAAAYGLVSYQTAYLKTHYPVEFYAAHINVHAKAKAADKVEDAILDARRHGVKLLPPDINNPSVSFECTAEGIAYGMSGLKFVSERAVDAVIAAHREAPFTSFMDFIRRAAISPHINKRAVESFIKVGAFDSIEPNRAMLLENLTESMKYAGKYARRKAEEEKLLADDQFEGLPTDGDVKPVAKRKSRKPKTSKDLPEPEMVPVKPWGTLQRVTAEHEMANFYISGHPFDAFAERFAGLQAATPLTQVDNLDPNKETGLRLITGVIQAVYVQPDKNGRNYAKVELNDGEMVQRIMVFSDPFAGHESELTAGANIAFAAQVEFDRRSTDGALSLNVKKVLSEDTLYGVLTEKVHVALTQDQLGKLDEVLAPHQFTPSPEQPDVNPTTVRLHLPDQKNPGNFLVADLAHYSLKASTQLIKDLEEAFGEDQVKLSFRRRVDIQPPPRPARRNNQQRSYRPR